MEQGTIGEFQITSTGDGPVRTFMPNRLSPNPPFQMDGTLNQTLTEAMLFLSRLDGISSLLPDTNRFLCACSILANQLIPSLTDVSKSTGLPFFVALESIEILVQYDRTREFTSKERARLFDKYRAISN